MHRAAISLLVAFSGVAAAVLHQSRIHDATHFHSDVRVALAVSSQASGFEKWRELVNHMAMGAFVDVIYGSLDAEVQDCTMLDRETLDIGQIRVDDKCSTLPALVCLNLTGTTFTPGRNALGKAVYQHQICRGIEYKYWLFVDDDAWRLRCAMCEGATSEGSCCFDTFVRYLLLDAVKHASIGTSTFAVDADQQAEGGLRYKGRPYSMLVHDCFDAYIHAIHVDAAPIFFPYIEDLEAQSWWESQALQFYFVVSCLTGANRVLGGYARPNLEEVRYPHGRVATKEELAALKRAVPALYNLLLPSSPKFKGYQQGNCGGLPVRGWQDPNYLNQGHRDSGWWRQSGRYHGCMTTMWQRFHEYMQAP